MEGEAPSAILKGLRNARVDGIQLVGELFRIDHEFAKDKWVFEVRLELKLKTEEQVTPFPQYSNWFVVVDSAYPFGEVEIFPSKVDGIREDLSTVELVTANNYKDIEKLKIELNKLVDLFKGR